MQLHTFMCLRMTVIHAATKLRMLLHVPILPEFRKTQVFLQKPNPLCFFGFHWLLGFIGFSDFLIERAVGKLVG